MQCSQVRGLWLRLSRGARLPPLQIKLFASRPMDVELARTFLQVVRSGSLVSAAAQLHVTQTAVTARIKNLEAQLKCRLFERNKAGARLTTRSEERRVGKECRSRWS